MAHLQARRELWYQRRYHTVVHAVSSAPLLASRRNQQHAANVVGGVGVVAPLPARLASLADVDQHQGCHDLLNLLPAVPTKRWLGHMHGQEHTLVAVQLRHHRISLQIGLSHAASGARCSNSCSPPRQNAGSNDTG
jgi:hypothetical protein